MPLLAGANRILILGEGDGRCLQALLRTAPAARFDVVEISPEMIALARRRTKGFDRVQFLCSDARTESWPVAYYDAILTFFFLDCFSAGEARGLILALKACAQAGWPVAPE